MRQLVAIASLLHAAALAEIPQPDDAPKPLSPAEAVASFKVPNGMEMRLLASEPLIHEPSGLCWDERGRLIVTELHGYNVEGQYDIDELNKTGKLDTEVRRIQASAESKERAKSENYGTVKLLTDSNGDGVMDHANVWADHLPLCYGVVPARGGVIVACPPDIVFLADVDGDGEVDKRETLFTGFGVGQPERGVNAPTWGVDNWIYFGRGHSGGTITGPHLSQPVAIGNTDFRIRADGSAIEPVTGSTKTIGMTFTEEGDRFVTTTTAPGLFVTPIPAHYFTRNPDAAAPLADAPAADYNTVFPLAPPHPWRVKREAHPEYFAFYRRISLSDAAASGFFTSACGPLVYQDGLLPGLRGQYLVCEPAQNLVHRAGIERDGTQLRLKRVEGEAKSEFLASTDPWFHPIGLHPAPDGSIAVVDFYREIIEDYSAIPRHLQQQYGVINGHDRGRLWLLTAKGHKPAPIANLAKLSDAGLVDELASSLQWRRITARRLLIERLAKTQTASIAKLLEDPRASAATSLAALYALEGMGTLSKDHVWAATLNESGGVQVHALRCAERFFGSGDCMVEMNLGCFNYREPEAILQSALSIGECRTMPVAKWLTELARKWGDLRWMDAAIASSAFDHEAEILRSLAGAPGRGEVVMNNLAGVIAARGDPGEIRAVVKALRDIGFAGKPMEILELGLEETKPLASGDAGAAVPGEPKPEQLAAWEKRVPEVLEALKAKPDVGSGRTLFSGICAACHKSHGIGVSVGPDLDAEIQRAPEITLRDILFPSEATRPGFETMLVKTQRGEICAGVAASDSPTSITIRMQGGAERTFLRKRSSISTLRSVSLMPAGFADALTPKQVADIIAFLRSPGGH